MCQEDVPTWNWSDASKVIGTVRSAGLEAIKEHLLVTRMYPLGTRLHTAFDAVEPITFETGDANRDHRRRQTQHFRANCSRGPNRSLNETVRQPGQGDCNEHQDDPYVSRRIDSQMVLRINEDT